MTYSPIHQKTIQKSNNANNPEVNSPNASSCQTANRNPLNLGLIIRQTLFSAIIMALIFFAIISPTHALAAKSKQAASSASKEREIPTNDIKRFVTAISIIRHYYIKSVDDNKLFDYAISGMVSDLDPHSSYLDAKALNELKIATKGSFTGIGIELTPSNGLLKVISPIDGSPAARANLQSGDLIVAIDGTLVRKLSLDDAVRKIRGKRGSTVKLTIITPPKEGLRTITLKRDVIKLKAVKSRMLAPGFGYVRIALFQGNAQGQLKTAIRKLKSKNGGKLSGLILDLRNNPGGLLDVGTGVANTFLDSKQLKDKYNDLIVYTKGRSPNSNLRIRATPGDMINGVPMVVLINHGSASASEIVAGALQDYNRAIILGTKSFGKGSVQTILPISKTTAIKLTTALYYTPAGREIQAEGIEPDVVVEQMKLEQPKKLSLDISESSLQSHLQNGNGDKKKNAAASNGDNDTESNLAKKDYQLYQSLTLLRGLNALK